MLPGLHAVVVTTSMLLAAASVLLSDGSSGRCGALAAGLGLILCLVKPSRGSSSRARNSAGGEHAR